VRKKLVLFGMLLLFPSLLFAHELTEVIKKKFPLKPGGVFVLTNRNGDIVITPWDNNMVSFTAKKWVKASNSRVAKRVFKEIKVVAEKRGNKVVVNTEYPENKGFLLSFLPGRHWEFKVDYQVFVPRKVFLEVESKNGDIEVGEIIGGVYLSTRNGYISGKGISGKIDVSSRNGDITLRSIVGSVSANTRNGNIEVDFSRLTSTENLSFFSQNGEIILTLPPDVKAKLYLSSENGEISSNFPLKVEKVGRKILKGEVNGGGVTIKVKTRNGDIRIEKKRE